MNTVNFSVEKDWNSGFVGGISVTNAGTSAISRWTVEFDAPFEITRIWGGEIVSKQGNRYVIRGTDKRANLSPGQSASFGFSANNPDGVTVKPSSYVVRGQTIQSIVPPAPVAIPLAAVQSEPLATMRTTTVPPAPALDTLASAPAVQFSTTSDRGRSFTGNITLSNHTKSSIKGWTLEFDAPFQITSLWNAQLVSQKGTRYTIRNLNWNATIATGKPVSFGFNANNPSGRTIAPSQYLLNGKPLTGASSGTPTPPVALPGLRVSDFSTSEADSTNAQFVVTLSQASGQSVQVSYSTANGTAIAGSDYTAKTGTLTFAPGETSKSISIALIDDRTVESNETILLNLSGATNATINDAQGVGTITDNDVAPPPTPPDQFNYGEALQKSLLFYEAQRSGRLPSDKRVDWRGDSAVNDGSGVGVDLSGGYYDAGDHVKFGFPMAASMTMLGWGVVEYRSAYQQSGQLDEVLEALKWGTDYILKAHVSDATGTKEFWGQVGNGNTDHAYWGSPEAMTMNRPAYKIDRQNPGSDLAGESAAALAAASIAFRPTDAAYADRLLNNAIQLFQFAETYKGKYSDSIADAKNFYNSWSGYEDELAWSAAWLHRATGNTTYLAKAETYYKGVARDRTQSWDDKSHGTAVLLAQATGKSRYTTAVETWLDFWSNSSGAGMTYTEGGLAWLDRWGSLRYSANTAFIAGVYADKVNDKNDRYSAFAENQVDYILGDNPRDFSYMVGFGNHYAKNPHHRAASGTTQVNDPNPNRHILYGALVGGPTTASDFAYTDSRTDYVANEVALDYNAGLTGALARLYNSQGGQPLTDAQLNALPGISVLS